MNFCFFLNSRYPPVKALSSEFWKALENMTIKVPLKHPPQGPNQYFPLSVYQNTAISPQRALAFCLLGNTWSVSISICHMLIYYHHRFSFLVSQIFLLQSVHSIFPVTFHSVRLCETWSRWPQEGRFSHCCQHCWCFMGTRTRGRHS